jgi:hypothetical protein
MYPNRRLGRRRSSVDRDWEIESDHYLDWVPDDREYIPKLRVPVVPLVVLGLLIGLIVAAQMSAHTTFIQDAFGGRSHHHHGDHHRRPVAHPTASPTASPTQAAPGGAAAMDCTLAVPRDPLSAKGLATPYQLGGGCSEADPNLQAFVQATILDPATGAVAVYEPLVITAGTKPAVAPVVPALPPHAIVDLLFGFNGNILTIAGTDNSLRDGRCVGGLRGSPFGQVLYCNAYAFFRAANADITAGKLKIPALGTGSDGLPCPTTRSFTMIDQDQSDNVTSRYLLTANGQTAQDNTANAASLQGAAAIANGSDNALLGFFLDPALGCTPMTAPDLSNPGQMGTSQAMDELAAASEQAAPVALTPVNDPMTMVNGAFSVTKTNLYRLGVDQPLLPRRTNTKANAQAYCTQMINIQAARLDLDKSFLVGAPSPVPSLGNNLFTFMAARLAGSFGNLNCQNYGLTDPVTLALDANGVATGATLNPAQQTPMGAPAPSKSPKAGHPAVVPSTPAPPTASASTSASASASPSPSPSRTRRY